ncbi:Integrase, catalytic core domain and Ribonuclease H-like domain-containing protein [Strongyloides ratti]|uniref:RNA-directed DNA polymerase n=1 Tax=Strongyloides ratti TaxID=34506 RepID=A0A090L0J4_STRRB|nr:Integrase, catalytic core domain and Ribonuclease H-like domain-containing protein [Strongyloides ratti]CEF61647.1 Integrase, catalytic core domain and Ribonuclease H-like domain-containing protein [Strongyloides ratti]
MALKVDLPYFEMKNTSRAEAFIKFIDWYLKCEKDKNGNKITENVKIQKFLTRLDLDAWTKVKDEISVYSIEMSKKEKNLKIDDYIEVFKKLYMKEKNNYIELVTMLKSINEKEADVDKLYEEITSVLRKTKMSSITIEELGALLMILKFVAPETIEPLILKKAAEERRNNKLERRDKLINNEAITNLGERYLDVRVKDGLIKLGNQYLIPCNLHQRCLEILYVAHQSAAVMKKLACQFWYWNTMSKDIQEVYEKCEICRENKIMPNKSPPFMEILMYPMERVHIKIKKCFSTYFLVIQDSFSRYLNIFQLKNMSAAECISCLNRAFSYLGYPTLIFSDQGRQFISQNIKTFISKNSITWFFRGAGHQSSNEAAERSIQTVKRMMKKMYKPGCDLEELFIKIKVNVNKVPSEKRDNSPNNLLFKYNCHSLIRTNKYLEDIPKYKIGSLVKFRLSKEKKWENGRVLKIHGSKLYDIEDNRNHIRFMYQDNMIEATENLNSLFYDDKINKQNTVENDLKIKKRKKYGKRKAKKRLYSSLKHLMITRTKKKKGHKSNKDLGTKVKYLSQANRKLVAIKSNVRS